MTKLNNSGQLNKIIGDCLCEQLDFDKKHVINLKGLYGGKLNINSDSIVKSFGPDDTYVCFDCSAKPTEDTSTETTIDEDFVVYDSYEIQLIFYGPDANIKAMTFYSRVQTQEVLYNLREKGLHIQDVQDSGELSDFVNAAILIRRDLTIHASCQFNIEKKSEFTDFAAVDTDVVYF